MPSAPGYKRDFKQERATSLARGEGPNNAVRKQARRDLEKKGLVKPFDGKDVNHKVALSAGGDNTRKNLEVTTAKKNRSYPRNSNGSMK